MTPHFKNPLAWLGTITLTILGILGNYFSIEMFFGIDFLFGSIFVFIIIYTYGFKPGLAASLLASLVTFSLWNHFFGVFILTAECLIVYLLHRRRGLNVVILDALYWFAIGTPLIFLFYYGVLGTEVLDTAIVALKYIVNGILNCLIFSILHLIYQQYILKKARTKSFQELLFITFTSVFLIPSMFLLVYEGNKVYRSELTDIREIASVKTQMISASLTSWESTHRASLNTLRLYIASSGNMDNHLKDLGRTLPFVQDIYVFDHRKELDYLYSEASNLPFYDVTMLKLTELHPYVTDVYFNQFTREQMTSIVVPIHEKNYTGFAVATYKLKDLLIMLNRMEPHENIEVSLYDEHTLTMYDLSQLKNGQLSSDVNLSKPFIMQPAEELNTNKMKRWKQSFLAEKADIPFIPWHPFTTVKIEPYQNDLYLSYIKLFGLVLTIIGFSIFIAYWLSNMLVSSIRRLSFITDQLSASKVTSQKIRWPRTSITEVSRLIKSFETLISDFNRVMLELRNKQKKLEYFAHFDVLTNMHNRYSFSEQLEKELSLASQFDRSVAVMFCDLDRFKLINDSLGHDTGDELLKELADTIRGICGERAILCRHGGDEFLIALPANGEESIESISKRLLEEISKPISIGENEVSVTCSIGISLYPNHADTIDDLISTADIAMYSAKEKGKNTFEFFNPELNNNLARRVQIENELLKALELGEFTLHYQPQVSLATRETTGLEALIRWNNPRLGSVSPAEFIPVAEETGMIRKIGEWVIDRAANDLNQLKQAGCGNLNVAVNISIKQFYHESLPAFILDKLHEHSIPAQQFKIEITESVVIDHFDLVLKQLRTLKEAGIAIALDDFGTGFSSLNYLKILPIDIVKIDRSFIQDILSNEQDAAIVQAVIQIAESKSLTVIAEGVETNEQAAFLHSIGCPQGQGYVFSRPQPIEEIMKQLKTKG
ncbi:bifunctional diguanylate cyclase/phosphodiesterase [Bacillus sp. SJS]|uniref:bifunctional diguanylate cyclase/phosphodiesterase n=1 Tax=Bacillus sp. SJS TaxID=1423321 RepID=UPI0018D45974|nr:EAL domain-containing protein [Bacillus sp. SJS]